MGTILFVCTGNTCRSTMSEALLKDMLSRMDHALGEIKVISAGVAAAEGEPASSQSVEVMQEKGIDLGDHRATLLSKELIEEADLVLTMTANHKNIVLALHPEAKDKVYTLKEYTGNGDALSGIDISDPFGQSIAVYRHSAKEIEEQLKLLLEKLQGKNIKS